MTVTRPRSLASLVCAATVALTFAAAAPAATVMISPVKDNTLIEAADNISEVGTLSNGVGANIFVGRTDKGFLRRAVLEFDVAGNIPAGSTINFAVLTLTMNRTKGGTETIYVHLATSEWGEGASNAPGQEGAGAPAAANDATWLHTFYSSLFWASPGGDFTGSPSASQNVGGNGDYSWMSAQMTADVQAWLDNPSSNHGWILLGNEATNKNAKRFGSRESAAPPTLLIDYTAGAPTGACCLLDGSCTETDSATCSNLNGTYNGDGTECASVSCPQPTGACCLPDGSCVVDEEGDCLAAGGTYHGDFTTCGDVECPLILTPYLDPLPIPQPATPVSGTIGGTATYDIEIVQMQQQLHSQLPPTTLWGYDGLYPGPTIEARTGFPITVNWINDLRDEFDNPRVDHLLPIDLCPHGAADLPKTVVHLHGGHVPPEVDGYPEDTFLPGESDTYVYPNNQPAGTIWYHDHALGITRLNVMLGLAGFYLIRDDNEDALGLPSGEFEIPLAFHDRSFNNDGSLKYPALLQDMFFGDYNLVNGKVNPYLEVKQAKYRFRLLGGANSRTYTLSFSNGMNWEIIGSEGGLLASPVTASSITLAPGERADTIVDFSSFPAGTEIFLTNSAPAPFPGDPGVGVLPDVMKFIVTADTGPTPATPSVLSTITPLEESDADMVRDFELRKYSDPCAGSIWLINGLTWHDITERMEMGDTEIWSFANPSGMMHPMHMHLVFFQVLDRQPNGVNDPLAPTFPPAPEESGWKDTVKVNPGEVVRVIARFDDYTGLYPYHCHILEHEDHEMMRQFQVLTPCPADFTGDREVDGADLAELLAFWGSSDDETDLNADGNVDGADLAILLAFWGTCAD
jgi:spore coat protein A